MHECLGGYLYAEATERLDAELAKHGAEPRKVDLSHGICHLGKKEARTKESVSKAGLVKIFLLFLSYFYKIKSCTKIQS